MTKPSNFQAVILAAGRGSRLGFLTKDSPKGLIKLAGQPLVEWQLRALRASGIKDIYIVTGYKGDQISRFPATAIENPEWESSNMLVSLLAVFPHLKKGARLIVSYSDIVYSAEAVRGLISHRQDLVLAYDPNWQRLWEARFSEPLSDAESFRISPSGNIIEIGEKVDNVKKIQGQYMGLFSMSQSARDWTENYLESNPGQKTQIDMTSLFSSLIGQGKSVYGSAIAGSWCEIDTPRDLTVAENLIEEELLVPPEQTQ